MTLAASAPGSVTAGRQSADNPTSRPLSFDPWPVQKVLLWMAVFAIAMGVFREVFLAYAGTGTWLTKMRQFNLDEEGTFQSWFSSLVLLLCAGLLVVAAGLSRREGDTDWRRWALLAGLFVFMSLDEASGLHEGLVTPLRAAFKLSGILYFSWVIPAIAVVGFLGVYFLPFLARLPQRHAIRFIGCGLIYVGGALGMEMVSSYYAFYAGKKSVSYLTTMCVEETLEIVGATLFCFALFAYLRERWGAWTLRVG